MKTAQNGYVRYFVVLKKAAYSLKTLSTDRNFAVNSNLVENTSGHEFKLVNNPSSSSERNDVGDVVWISQLELNSLAYCSVLSLVEDSTERTNQLMETVSLNTVPERTSKI